MPDTIANDQSVTSCCQTGPVQVYKKILLPLDGSVFGEAALEMTKNMLKVLKSEVILLFVIETVQHIHTIGGPDHFVYTEQTD